MTKSKKKKLISLLKDDRDLKRLPFNWCDMWCERCDKIHRCSVYQKTEIREAQHIDQGEDPDDPAIWINDLKEDFEEACKLMKKDMRKMGMNPQKAMKEVEKHRESEPPEFPVVKKAESFMKSTRALLGQLSEQICFDPYFKDKLNEEDMEIISWYHTIIPVKVRRMIESLWQGMIVEGPPDLKELSLKDAYWTSEVIFKAIKLSKQSLLNVLEARGSEGIVILNLVGKLQEIENEVRMILEQVFGKEITIFPGSKNILELQEFQQKLSRTNGNGNQDNNLIQEFPVSSLISFDEPEIEFDT